MNDLNIGDLVELAVDEERSLLFSGLVLFANSEVLVLNNYSDEDACFDGVTVFRLDQLVEYRIWDEEEADEIEEDNRTHLSIEIGETTKFEEVFAELEGEVISIYENILDEDFVIGVSDKMTSGIVHFKAYGETKNDVEEISFPIKSVSYFCFESSIEDEYLED